MIFVDTSGWYAGLVPSDQDHRAAIEWLSRNSEPLITTDYVLDDCSHCSGYGVMHSAR